MTAAALLHLLETRGDGAYGESVSQRDHARQCAALAGAAGASEELVAAALLHDIGHLLTDGDEPHERVGARVLAGLLGPAVAGPVALHVTAKRWQCAVEPDRRRTLSAASRASLRAQGGPLDESGRRRFESHPGFGTAVALREWDDAAKVPGLAVPPVGAYRAMLEALGARWEAATGRSG